MGCCKCEEYKWDDKPEETYISETDGKEYCLFHAPHDEKKMDGEIISVDEFNEQVSERIQTTIDLEDEKAKCNLSGTIFPGKIRFTLDSPLPEISFRKACFVGTACFSAVTFGMDVDFDLVEFREDVYFGGTKFRGIALFTSVEFRGGGYFNSFVAAPDVEIVIANCTISSLGIIFRDCEDPTCLDLIGQYDLLNIRFNNSPWDRTGRIKAWSEDMHLQPTRDFYQRMKAKYKAENNEYEASKWHIAEKEAQLKLLGKAIKPLRESVKQVGGSGGVKALWRALTQQPDKSFFAAFGSWLKPLSNAVAERCIFRALWLYKYSSGFGECPVRALIWLVVLVGVAALFPGDMRAYIPLMKQFTPTTAFTGASLFQSFGHIGWQLLITTQAALFAFALRNQFRR